MRTTAVRTRADASSRRLQWHPAAWVVVALYAVAGWSQRWNGDDAFIVFRVVDNTVAGHGVVYNLGERVEAVTSPLWFSLLLVGRLVTPISTEWFAVLSGLALATTGLALAVVGSTRLDAAQLDPVTRPHRLTDSGTRTMAEPAAVGRLLPAGALVWLALPPAWTFATSGLETGLGFAWLGACQLALVLLLTRRVAHAGEAATPRLAVGAAVLFGLGPLIRPDFGVYTLALLAALYLLRRSAGWSSQLRLLAAAAALPIAVQVVRMGYYAALLPNTLLAKEASLANWSQGWLYLADLVLPYGLMLPVAVIVVLLWDNAGRQDLAHLLALLTLPVAGVVHGLAVVRGGGDFMHGRLLLPAVFAVLVPVAMVRVRSRVEVASVALLAVWAVVAAALLRVPPETPATNDGISDQREFYVSVTGSAHPVTLDDYAAYGRVTNGSRMAAIARSGQRALVIDEVEHQLAADALAPVVYETGGIGLPGAAGGEQVYILDRLGLADAYAARQRLVERRRPGHDKPLPLAWVWGRFGVEQDTPATERAAARDARAALSCPPLDELRAAITERLTVERFVDNIAASFRLTRLRYPSDPAQAAAKLCTGATARATLRQ